MSKLSKTATNRDKNMWFSTPAGHRWNERIFGYRLILFLSQKGSRSRVSGTCSLSAWPQMGPKTGLKHMFARPMWSRVKKTFKPILYPPWIHCGRRTRPSTTQNVAKQASSEQTPCLAVCLGQSEGSTKSGALDGEKVPS